MPVVADSAPDVPSPAATAALLLAASSRLAELGLPHPTAAQVVQATGVSRSRAYELKERLEAVLAGLVQPTGRPRKPDPQPATPEIATEVLDHVYSHPGCVSGGPGHHRYGDGFRLFVLDLLERHRDVPLQALSETIRVPLGTLKDVSLRQACVLPIGVPA